MLVKVKGLGGAGALRELIDSNSSFPVILTPSMVLAMGWRNSSTLYTIPVTLHIRFCESRASASAGSLSSS